MNELICAMCGGQRIATERRLNGNNQCMDCSHIWKNGVKPKPEPKLKPQLKVHDVAALQDNRQMVHMTLTRVDGINYNLWVFLNEDGTAYVDVSSPYTN